MTGFLRRGAFRFSSLAWNPCISFSSRFKYASTLSTFDTQKVVEKLEKAGFSPQQSEGILICINEAMEESLTHVAKTLVTKDEQNEHVYLYKTDFSRLKSEIQMLEKNDFTTLKTENERLEAEIRKLQQKLKDEVNTLRAGVRLDLNLEKGRIRDETLQQEMKIRETDTRIETEMSNIRSQMEGIKFEIIRYIIGTITGAGALFMAYLRLMM